VAVKLNLIVINALFWLIIISGFRLLGTFTVYNSDGVEYINIGVVSHSVLSVWYASKGFKIIDMGTLL